MKNEFKDTLFDTELTSKWRKISETNFEHTDKEDFRDRAFGRGKCNTSKMAKKLTRNGIAHIASFPPAVQCSELVLECARHYDPERKIVVAPDGSKISYLMEISIAEVFNVPTYDKMIYKSKDDALALYWSNTRSM